MANVRINDQRIHLPMSDAFCGSESSSTIISGFSSSFLSSNEVLALFNPPPSVFAVGFNGACSDEVLAISNPSPSFFSVGFNGACSDEVLILFNPPSSIFAMGFNGACSDEMLVSFNLPSSIFTVIPLLELFDRSCEAEISS